AGLMKMFALLPDSRTLVIAEGIDLSLFELATGKRTKTWQGPKTWEGAPGQYWGVGPALFVAASADGKQLGHGNESFIPVWDVKRGLRLPKPMVPFNQIRALSFSPDTKALAFPWGAISWVAPAPAAAVLNRLGDGGGIPVFAPTGRYLA